MRLPILPVEPSLSGHQTERVGVLVLTRPVRAEPAQAGPSAHVASSRVNHGIPCQGSTGLAPADATGDALLAAISTIHRTGASQPNSAPMMISSPLRPDRYGQVYEDGSMHTDTEAARLPGRW